MDNKNEQKSFNSEVQQDTYTDAKGHNHTKVTRTTETANSNHNSYGNGYVNGQASERLEQEKNLAARDNKNAASGLVIGILLTGLVGLTAGAFWFFNQRDEAVKDNAVPVAVPTASSRPSSSPSPQASQAPQKQTTIIERTRDVPVPVERTRDIPVPILVPQPQTSATSAPPKGEHPTANPTPSTQPNSTQSQSNRSSTSTQGKPNNSTSSTSPINTEGQTDTKRDSSSSSSSNDSTSSSSQ